MLYISNDRNDYRYGNLSVLDPPSDISSGLSLAAGVPTVIDK